MFQAPYLCNTDDTSAWWYVTVGIIIKGVRSRFQILQPTMNNWVEDPGQMEA